MARVHSSFSVKLTTVMNKRIDAAYADLENCAAWAGIRDDKIAAYHGRLNYYGHFCGPRGKNGYAPARPFLRASTVGGDSAKKIAQIIKQRITSSRSESWEKVYGTDSHGDQTSDTERTEFRTKTFPQGVGNEDYRVYNSPKMILRALGRQMAQNQRERILSWGFHPNTESTRARKGKDKPPLVDTGNLLKSIDGGLLDGADD